MRESVLNSESLMGWLGQYFTSENLCDIICAFCIRSDQDKVLDPTCGTGTFLIRAYDRLRNMGNRNHLALLSQLWGVDVAPFPAELATINLFRQSIGERGNFPRIVCEDFFRVSPGERFPFPPPKVDLDHPETVEEPIPMFDGIVGNFPYVSADQVERREVDYLKFLHQRLVDDWFEDYPDLFYYKDRRKQENFEKLISAGHHRGHSREGLQNHISSYADLYVYLFFHAARFLNRGGRLGIVTSNAWLDVNYGYELQRFFLRHFRVVAVLESRCEPWFTEASVNTIVTIIERCESQDQRDEHLVRFVKVKRRLEELVGGDPVLEGLSRKQRLDGIISGIEQSGRKYSKTYPIGTRTEEDNNFRIRVRRQSELEAELRKEAKTVKWGRLLRAPQIYFDIQNSDRTCVLREIAVPKRGGLTRINEFFHVTPEISEEFEIEDEYLLPLIKSPKESNRITVDGSQLRLRIFMCTKTKEELKKLKHDGALSYIEWGEKQTYESGEFKGLSWPEGTWVKHRVPGWWALPVNEVTPGQLFMSEAFGDAHLFRFSDKPIAPDKRLYYLDISSLKDKPLRTRNTGKP